MGSPYILNKTEKQENGVPAKEKLTKQNTSHDRP